MIFKSITVLLEVLYLSAFWLFIVTAIVFLRKTTLSPIPLFRYPAEFKLKKEDISFKSLDGLSLKGWVFTHDVGVKPWLILCHGLETHRSDLLEIASGLYDEGFNILLFDFRGHGESEGRVTSFGWLERLDLLGALVYLSGQKMLTAERVGVVGFSMGAAVALMVANEDERIAAVVADGSYTNCFEGFKVWLSQRPILNKLRFIILPYFSWVYRMRMGISPNKVNPNESHPKAHCAKFFIGGSKDAVCPVEQTEALFAMAREPKKLWIVNNAGHTDAYQKDSKTYTHKVAQFMREHL